MVRTSIKKYNTISIKLIYKLFLFFQKLENLYFRFLVGKISLIFVLLIKMYIMSVRRVLKENFWER